MHSFISSSAILASTLFSAVHAFGVGQRSGGQDLAVYWGQGSGQKSLASFCADSTIDIIPIGFVNVFPDQNGTYGFPGTNFGNACGGAFVDSKNETTQLLGSCPQIGADITYCQSQGKKILLSLGGGSTGVFVASDDSAVAFGDFLHGAFGPPSSSWTGPRPFGNACVDGFDFDIEATATAIPVALGAHYATMVNHMRTLGNMMITASPQCIVPDANMGDALTNAYFDAVFVQFYNTPQCSARAFFDHTYGAYGGPATNISYDSWISWMAANSKNPNALVYLGLPAAPGATYGDMYLTTTEAQEIITFFQAKYPAQFGGAMLWEATFSDNNQVNGMSYAANVKSFLVGSSKTSTTASASSTSSTSSTPTSPTFSPTGTGSYSFPGGTSGSGSGYPSGSPTSSPTSGGITFTGRPTSSSSAAGTMTYTDSNGSTHTYTPSAGPTSSSSPPVVTATDRNGNTYTYASTNIQPTGTSSSGSPFTYTDSNGATHTYAPSVGPTTSSSPPVMTATDRNGNTWTYTSTNIQPTGTSTSGSPIIYTDSNGSTHTYTPPSGQTTSVSSSNAIVTATDRYGNTYTYTSTNIQPTGTIYSSQDWSAWDPTTSTSPVSTTSSSSSSDDSWTAWDATITTSSSSSSSPYWSAYDPSATQNWPAWDPSSSTASPATTSSSSVSQYWSAWDPTATQSWAPWDPSTSAAPTSTATTSWAPWDPSTSAATTSTTSSSSTNGWVWHFSSSSTSSSSSSTTSQTWAATITASDAITMTIVPLPVAPSSTYTPSIAVWSSYWTQRGPAPSGTGSFPHPHPTGSPTSPASTASSESKPWSFTGWASMPAYSTLAPLPLIATVTPATSVGAVTSAAAVGASASASAGPSVGVYVQPAPFTGKGSVARPVWGVVGAVVVGALGMVL